MFINSIEFILAIGFGLLQINQAAKYNVTGPVIVQRNCTNIVYRTDVQYFQKPQYYEWLNFIVYTNETDFTQLSTMDIDLEGGFLAYREIGRQFDNYADIKADPPWNEKTWGDKFTAFVFFRFPDDSNNNYEMAMRGDLLQEWQFVKTNVKVGKQRCFPQEDITGCDPYCVCDTVVEKKCQDGSSLIGMCLYSGNMTSKIGIYSFNEVCPTTTTTTTETSTQTESSSNPSTSQSSTSQSSSTESVNKSFIGSQALESMIGLFVGGIVAVLLITAFTFYVKKKKGLQLTNSDKSESKQTL